MIQNFTMLQCHYDHKYNTDTWKLVRHFSWCMEDHSNREHDTTTYRISMQHILDKMMLLVDINTDYRTST